LWKHPPVLPASLERLSRDLSDDDLLLDVGGWGKPLNRADWVIDVMPYETRGRLGSDGAGPERFSADTWTVRDICDREPWPFEDGQFDFVVCSHVLEDIRDPLFVCSELQRVAKAGYIEVPSRLEEQSWGVQGDWVGWGHHHWIIERDGDRLDFLFKPHMLHAREEFFFLPEFHQSLTEEQRVERLWWSGGFETNELFLFEHGELDAHLADFVSRHLELSGAQPAGRRAQLKRLLGR
jgi:hypothetical protein